jgi:hypothetical protein
MRARFAWRTGLLGLALLAGLTGCGSSGSSGSGPAGTIQSSSVFEHNAQFNEGRTIRWPNVPITVATNGIATTGEITAWTDATGGRVTFSIVGSGSANVTIGFRSGSTVCGSTTVVFGDDGVITSASVLVAQTIFRSSVCVRTVTHEVGHAIGFLNHTADGGLMDLDGGNGQITGDVSSMLSTLYSFPPNTPAGLSQLLSSPERRPGGRRTMTFVYHPRP